MDYKVLIQTKYIAPTATKGARIKAVCVSHGESVTVPHPYGLSGYPCHYEAVKAWIAKHGADLYAGADTVTYTKGGYIFSLSYKGA